MGLVAAFMAWFLSGDPALGGVGWPFWLSIVLALGFAAVLGAIIQYFAIGPLTGQSPQPLAVFWGLLILNSSIPFLHDEGLPAFLDWFPVASGGFPYAIAIPLAIIAAILNYLLMYKFVIVLREVDHFPLLLMTIAVNFILGSLIENVWGATPKRFDAPWSGKTFDLGSTRIGWDQVVTIVVGITIAIALAVFFWSKWGVRMRAIAEDGSTARLLGINARKVSLTAWAIGTVVAGAAMILNTSSTVLELGSAEGLILKGFIAAVLGGFTSLAGTFVGGLLIGVGEALAGGQISTSLQPTIALLVVVVVLLVAPGGFSRTAKTREV
jgi:branched-chain amino acid transport system permease protein